MVIKECTIITSTNYIENVFTLARHMTAISINQNQHLQKETAYY